MDKESRVDFRKRVISYYENEGNRSAKNTIHFFQLEGKFRSTVWRIIQKHLKHKTTEDLPKSGRPKSVATSSMVKKIKEAFEGTNGASVRTVAASLNISKTLVGVIKKKTLNIKSYTQESTPLYKDHQLFKVEAESKCLVRKIHDLKKGSILIIADETYVPADPLGVPGLKQNVPSAIKYLVWQAIGNDGRRSSMFVGIGTMNSEIYLEECIKRRLFPFIEKEYPDKEIIFWPGCARYHYSKLVMKILAEKNLYVVDKDENPPTLLQSRGIEMYWKILKREYSKRKVSAKSLNTFIKRIKNDSDNIPDSVVKSAIDSDLQKL